MKRFHLAQFLDLANNLRKLLVLNPAAAHLPIPDDIKRSGRPVLAMTQEDCKALDFKGSTAVARRITVLLDRPESTCDELAALMDDFLRRAADEMSETHFMALSSIEAEGYGEPWKGWDEDVLIQFPGAKRDVLEAGRCFALGRYTASVFHLMRVLESGIRSLRAALGIEAPVGNPSWHTLLEHCDTEIAKKRDKRSEEFKGDLPFFSEAVSFLRSVMYAWRNPTMHVEEDYTREEAEAVKVAVQGFMRHLATKLSQI